MIDVYSLYGAAYGPRTAKENRDLSRAAAERYLLLQSLSEVPAAERHPRGRRLLARLSRAIRSTRTRRRSATTPVA